LGRPSLKQGAESIKPGLSVEKTFRLSRVYLIEPTVQIFNILNSDVAVLQAIAVSTSATSFIGGSGGPVTTITPPRLRPPALMFASKLLILCEIVVYTRTFDPLIDPGRMERKFFRFFMSPRNSNPSLKIMN
jgi:hypothetical protein